jgi:hypothetical protein
VDGESKNIEDPQTHPRPCSVTFQPIETADDRALFRNRHLGRYVDLGKPRTRYLDPAERQHGPSTGAAVLDRPGSCADLRPGRAGCWCHVIDAQTRVRDRAGSRNTAALGLVTLGWRSARRTFLCHARASCAAVYQPLKTRISSDCIAHADVWAGAALFTAIVILKLIQALIGRPIVP